jgi:hypothetical protein
MKFPRQCPLVLLERLIEEKVRRSEVERNGARRDADRVLLHSIGILNFNINLGKAALVKY